MLQKTKAIIRSCRRLGHKGLIPAIVLAEFYALARKTAGRDAAEKYFAEMLHSGLDVVPLSTTIAKQAGVLRAKYQEKIPCGDCLIAAMAVENKVDRIVTEDPYFARIREVRAKPST